MFSRHSHSSAHKIASRVGPTRLRGPLILLAAMFAVVAGPAAGAAAALKPVNNLAPEIVVGHVALGETMGCGAGSWSNNPDHFTYKWVRAGITTTEGVSPTGVGKRLTEADEGKAVYCVVQAFSGAEASAEVESSNSITLPCPKGSSCGGAVEPPKLETPPAVSGEGKVGATLTCSTGAWSGSPSYSFRWLRAKTGGEAEAISEATSQTYKVASADEGSSLSCSVTASNSGGFSTAQSSNSIKIPGKPPKAKALPVVTGALEVGATLTCLNPETNWEGSRPLTYEYRWLRAGAKIATAPTYTVVTADEGHELLCEVTATNSEGSATSESKSVSIQRKPPGSLTRPGIKDVSRSGTPQVGDKLECSQGTWTGSPTSYEYEWLRESLLVTPPSTNNKYVVAALDEGEALYCIVTASNLGGKASSQSGSFVIPEQGGSPPEPTGKPVASGSFEYHQTVACSAGTWNNSPTKFAYQWLRDASVSLGTESTYKLVAGDEGHELSCRVTAISRFGEASEESERHKVKGKMPAVIVPPQVNGNGREGEEVQCSPGEWSGAPAPTFSYQWLSEGKAITGATKSGYKILKADRGTALICMVTAENNQGSVPAETSPLYVPGSPPEGEAPSIKGETGLGKQLTCVEAKKWRGAPEPKITYEWRLNGVPIPLQTANTYTITVADRGFVVTCSETGTSREGTATETSRGVHVPGVPAEPVTEPQVSGSASLGATLTCNRGIWKGSPPPSFTYQWLRDGVAISGATASTYIVEPADQGHLLSCIVTGANSEATVEAESTNGLAIPMRLATSGVSGFTATGTIVKRPSAATILASLKLQLTRAGRGLHLSSVRKHGGFTFPFTAPAAGTLEMRWYETVKAAHSSSKKTTQLLVGRTSGVYTAAIKRTMHLKLTSKGRAALKGKKQVKIIVRGIFTVTHGGPVTWTGSLLLSH